MKKSHGSRRPIVSFAMVVEEAFEEMVAEAYDLEYEESMAAWEDFFDEKGMMDDDQFPTFMSDPFFDESCFDD